MVGLLEYREAQNNCIQLIIEPKYELFHEIYKEVIQKISSISSNLALAIADLHLGSLGNLPIVNVAIWTIEKYASHNSPYLFVEEPLSTIRTIPYNVVPSRKIVRLNERYYATLATSILILSQALTSISTYSYSYSIVPLLKVMISNYIRMQRRLLARLAANPQVIDALRGHWQKEPDEDVLLEVKVATRYTPIPGTGKGAWLLLTPSSKIYEIYVFIKTIEALQQKYNGNIKTCNRLLYCYYMYKINNYKIIKIYYNRPPLIFSRAVYSIAGSRPHPDILLAYGRKGEKRVIIDVKYRLPFSLTNHGFGARRLKPAEALRLLGYLADLAHNKSLKGILAVPERFQNEAKDRLVESLDGLNLDIQVVEVNPRNDITELINALP